MTDTGTGADANACTDGISDRPSSATGQEWDADAIVIGSGFGGAVAAARLAQAGLSVLVIERGRRWPAGSFPREPNLGAGRLWKRGHGLYDLRWLGRMASVQASGWGGGSLVYANVFARPPHILLDERWPGHLRRDELDPYYDLAAHMLEVHPTTVDPSSGRLPGRTQMVQDLVGSMDLTGEAMFRPNLAVTFGDPDTVRTNIHGVKRRGCAFVGECVAGCNHGAKNSLDYTYLAVAEAAGARTLTDSQVDRLAPVPGGYQVSVSTPSDPSAAPRRFTAAQVFLAAGAVASTELLLRARDVHRTLPQLSRRLGEGFSGNGDYLDLADIRTTTDLTTGPTITTSTVLDVPEGKRSVWFQVQDGAIPSSLSRLIEHLIPARTARRTWRRLRRHDDRQRFALLSMGRDSGKGVLRLNRRGVARLRWQNRWQGHLYRAQGRVAPLIARSLGSSVFAPPTWSVFRRTVTVHPLGGVPTGPDANTAVADDLGEVHGAPGLYVIDGSVIPAATGVNPSATILAAAERSIEHIIRRSGQPKWRAPEWSAVQHTPAPEDDAFAFMADRRATTAGGGIRFTEQMHSSPTTAEPAIRLHLAGHIPSLNRFLTDPEHTINVEGTIELPRRTPARTRGTMRLFPRSSSAIMLYDLEFTDDRDHPSALTGSKTLRGRGLLALLRSLTTLDTELTHSGTRQRTSTTLTIRPRHVVHLLQSIAGEGFTGPRRACTRLRFVAFFARSTLRSVWKRNCQSSDQGLSEASAHAEH